MRIEYEPHHFCFDLYTDNDIHAGKIEYIVGGEQEWIATHTVVFPGHEGKGYAGLLLDALVQEAAAQKVKIVPRCSYVRAAFDKYPDKYAEVIQ